MEVQKMGDIVIIKNGSNVYVYNKKSHELITASNYANIDHLIKIATNLAGYINRTVPIKVENGWGKYTYAVHHEFIKEYNDYEFYNVLKKYVAVLDGVPVETTDFKTFTACAGRLRLGTKKFEEILKNLESLKKLRSENIRTVKPYFLQKLSAKVIVKHGPRATRTVITLDNGKITLRNYATETGIYDVIAPVDELDRAIKDPENYAEKIYVKIRAKNIRKISSPNYKPGYTLYSACGKVFFISNDGTHIMLNGKRIQVENGEVDLCSLKK